MSRPSKINQDHPQNVTMDDEVITSTNTKKQTQWYSHPAIKWILQICSFLSLVSVCCNTPKTFEVEPSLLYVTFAVDLAILAVFSVEMVVKIMRYGFIIPKIKGKSAYLRNHWCRFDFSMMVFLFISVILHVIQIEGTYGDRAWIGILRSPRPLIFVRIFRIVLNVRLPTARISQIIKRSSQQIYNVTLFFLFFMSFYGILGVQFFGDLKYHCVRSDANMSDLQVGDLAIPDTLCTPNNDSASGYKCPGNLTCRAVDKNYSVAGYTTFDNFLISFFSVYNAASQEGWSAVMYDAIDALAPWRAYIYFISLIFFLAWLVKNVFIAVIIETFAEIRVQFQQMWGSPDTMTQQSSMILANDDNGWKLVSIDERKPHSLAPRFAQKWIRSPYFNTVIMFLVLADALIAASRTSNECQGQTSITCKLDWRYYAQVVFTIIFALEVLLKLAVYGPKGYIKPSRHKFEAALAFFSTFNLIPDQYQTIFTFAQVLRLFRLIKASPVLEEFCWKIFGPGKKLGSLVLFTMAILIITSGVSLQLFCYIKDKDQDSVYHEQFSQFFRALESTSQILSNENWYEEMVELARLARYHHGVASRTGVVVSVLISMYFVIVHLFMTSAFMSMFQILLKKGWTDIMYETLRKAGSPGAAFVAIYFICYQLLVSVIILSLFVAVILDNLDLDEDLKRVKQLKAREMSTAQQQNLPRRLRVFEKFPNQPQMVNISKRAVIEFDTPKVRESFMRTFVDGELSYGSNGLRHRRSVLNIPKNELPDLNLLTGVPAVKSTKTSDKKEELSMLISESSEQRTMNSSDPMITKGISSMSNQKSMLSGGQGQNSALRLGKVRTNISMTNTRILSVESGNSAAKQRNGILNSMHSQHTTISPGRNNPGDDIDIQILQQKKQQAEIKRSQQESDLRENHPLFDTPLFIVGRESRFRQICKIIVTKRYEKDFTDKKTGKEKKSEYKKFWKFWSIVPIIDWIMIIITLASCIFMAHEHPENRVTDYRKTPLRVAECIFVAAMSIEVILKVFAYGLFFTPNALIRDVGGAVDLFIYLISLLFLVTMIMIHPEDAGIGYKSYGHILLILRCMRPLRIFILVPHIRKVVYELVKGFKEILLVTILLLALLFVFASYGVQRYGGKLKQCNDPHIDYVKNETRCKGVFMRKIKVTEMDLEGEVKFLVPRVWANPTNFHFDNVISAMLALFEVLSLEGWLEIRDVLMDRIGPLESIYVHVFVFIGVLIGLTLFVGVVISNYSQNKGTALLTVDQRRWLDLKGRINLTQPLHIPPRPEKSRIREWMFDVTQHKFFKRSVAVIVALNSGLLFVPWYTNIKDCRYENGDCETPIYPPYLQAIAVGFVIVFLIEVLMKLIALSPKGYWYSRRNRLDLFVTSVGIMWTILHFSVKPSDGSELSSKETEQRRANREVVDTMGYLVIILRFFTITGKHATLKMLMLTIVESMLKSFFLIIGMFLLMLFYAYAGVLLFGMVRYGQQLNRHANFRTAWQAILLLFRIVTGEDWNKIMHDCMIAEPDCDPGNRNYWERDCGDRSFSVIYFLSFYIIITYIMLNLLVAIIMENFSLFYSNEEDALLSYSDIRMYQTVWNSIDKERRGAIPNKHVPLLLSLLQGRLQIDRQTLSTKILFKRMCYEIEYLHGGPSGEATFHDVLVMLSYRSVDIRKSLQLEELLIREDLETHIAEEVAKRTMAEWLTACIRRIRVRGHTTLARKSTQEPFYVVTEAEEPPLVETAVDDLLPEPSSSTCKQKITRNASEPLTSLQIPKKLSSSLSDSQFKDRVKKNSLTSRSKLSEGTTVANSKEKTQNVEQWWKEQMDI